MKIVVTGSTGLIGSALLPRLRDEGHHVTGLVRGVAADQNTPWWDPAAGRISPGALDGVDAVVHLAGEGIAAGRWTAARKARICDSRVNGTRVLCEALAGTTTPPRVLLAASAVGFYGDRGDELLDESAALGQGFLSDTCQKWEAEADPARARGIRVVHLRIGIVLSPSGGALAKMLPPFMLGVGGVLGSGQQFMSWIAIDDLIGIMLHALTNDGLAGAVNAVAPRAVTNREFTKALGHVLRRPTVFPVPAFAARLAFGEMADALLLASTRVQPARLMAEGFEYAYPELEGALRHVLGRTVESSAPGAGVTAA